MKSLCFLFLLLSVLLLGQAKFVADGQSLTVFNRKSWTYLSKFAIAPGTGNFEVRLQFNKKFEQVTGVPDTVPLQIAIYLDDDWNAAMNAKECKDKLIYSRMNLTVFVPTSGSFSQVVRGELKQTVRTHVWFFVVHDCDKNLAKYYTAGNRLKWELEVRNSDGSHFSEEENGMILPQLLIMGIIIGFFVTNALKFYKFYKTEESVDYPTLILSCVLLCELAALFCEVLHLWAYSYNGKGYFILNFGNQAFSVLSQFTITCLLLLIAYGWTIRFMEFEDMDIMIPIAILLGILHIMIVGIGRITDNEHYRYHDYENWAGIVVIVLRLMFYAYWIYLFKGSYETAHGEEKVFYARFGVLSTVYFLVFPVLVIIASFAIPPYYRHKVIVIGTLLIQTLTIIVLTYLFTNKKSKYYNVSLKGRTLLMSNKLD